MIFAYVIPLWAWVALGPGASMESVGNHRCHGRGGREEGGGGRRVLRGDTAEST